MWFMFYQLTNSIEEVLRDFNFSIKKISDDTPPDEHFGERFESLSKECSLAIVVLDGLRPNVLFEYGYLRGINKVILPVKNKNAAIAVKSLYPLSEKAETQEIQNHTGLTKAQFSHLKEPSIDYFSQLSDRHGINLIEVDCNAELSSKNNPKTKLRTEIEKIMPKILCSYTKESLIAANVTNSELLKKSEKIMLQLLQYSTKIVPFESTDVKRVIKEIKDLELDLGGTAPSKIYITASSLFKSLADRTPVPTIDLIIEYYSDAINLLKKPLNTERDSQIRAEIQLNLGNLHVEFSEITNQEENLREAIRAFNGALTIYTKEKYPNEYGVTQHNLGNVYARFSNFEDKEKNLKAAIRIYREALTVRTKEEKPIQYAMTQNNIGAAYSDLSEVSNNEEHIKEAIKGFNEALAVFTAESYPMKFAKIQEALKRLAVLNVFASLLADLK